MQNVLFKTTTKYVGRIPSFPWLRHMFKKRPLQTPGERRVNAATDLLRLEATSSPPHS